MTIIARFFDPHEIWNHLRTQYYSDTAFSFIIELNNLFTLGSTYDSTKSISKFIENFESKWTIITQLSDGSNNLYRKKFNAFLGCNEAKRDILLSALVPYMENIIDNISTKTDITFAEAKSGLISHPSQSSSQDAALVVTSTKGNGKKSWKKRYHNKSNSNHGSSNYNNHNKLNSNHSSSKNYNHPNDSAKPWYTYCKKHNLMPFEGHTWMICRQLKEEQRGPERQEERRIGSHHYGSISDSCHSQSDSLSGLSDTSWSKSDSISCHSEFDSLSYWSKSSGFSCLSDSGSPE